MLGKDRDSRDNCILARYERWLDNTKKRSANGRSEFVAVIYAAYPGGSKERVRKAGNAVRDRNASAEDLAVIDTWRASHRSVLNTFQAILRARTRGTTISVAQRHKRKRTIFDKLERFDSMQLHRMDDVAGCRLIFDSLDQLTAFREKFLKAKFAHKRRNEKDKYDYIKSPKSDTGYRGIHDIYIYDVNSAAGQYLKGLLIEIQYRTRVQHAWATCVEVIGHITESQPKFKQGDTRYQRIMMVASELLARAYEKSNSSLPDLTDKELVTEFVTLDKQLNLMSLLKSLNTSDKDIEDNKNVILMFRENEAPYIKAYRDATEAIRELFILEKRFPGADIVLVKADSSEEIRLAFKNYFSDAREFIKLIEAACSRIVRVQSGKKTRGKSVRSRLGL